MEEADRLAGPVELSVGDAGLAVAEVLADGPFKQPGVLEDHAEEVVDVFAGDVVEVDPVHRDRAAV